MLIGHPGVGKSRSIDVARDLYCKVPEIFLAPISMTWAALTDSLNKAKRHIIRPKQEARMYNAMYICADELGAFIHKFDSEMTDGLSALYDPRHYSQHRRSFNIKIALDNPQVNLLCGSTPQNLTSLLPDKAWGQGFMSRVIMIFSDERIIVDDFAPESQLDLADLEKDICAIGNLYGQFTVTKGYAETVNQWMHDGQPIAPGHPRLMHYCARRKVNLYKLSMIISIDRGNDLIIDKREFDIALKWMVEAEDQMPHIFKAGASNADATVMDEIVHHIRIADKGKGISSQEISRIAGKHIPIHSVGRVIDVLVNSGQIDCIGKDRITQIKYYKINQTANDD